MQPQDAAVEEGTASAANADGKLPAGKPTSKVSVPSAV